MVGQAILKLNPGCSPWGRAIEALADLAPQTALVRRDGTSEEIPVEALQVGDVVIVKPNERIAADGFVIQGESSVNQTPITGKKGTPSFEEGSRRGWYVPAWNDHFSAPIFLPA
jgi:P-type E1-E2 ATPase